MRCRNGFAIAALSVVLACALLSAQTRSDRLVVGEQKTFRPGYPVGDLAISNPDVCDYRVVSGRREIMLIANGQGFTTLTVWDQRGVKRDEIGIEVVSREFAKTLADLSELLRQYPGVTIKPLGNRAVITGTVATQDELQAIRDLAAAAGDALCTVTVRGSSTGREPAGDPVEAAAPPAPAVTKYPDPPPPVRRAPSTGAAPAPVPLGRPATPGSSSDWSRPVGTGSIEYLVEVFESPASAPPPESAGPQGRRVYIGRLRTEPGVEIRHAIPLPVAGSSTPHTLGVGLTPTVQGPSIATGFVLDTDAPVGGGAAAGSGEWVRAILTFAVRPGQTRYLREQELARSARIPATSPRPTSILIAITPSFVSPAPRESAAAQPDGHGRGER